MDIICKMIFGSHLYGLNTPTSDTDYKSIYLPTKKELLLGTWKKVIRISGGKANEKNTAEDVDEEAIALPEFISQACKGETYAIDMLHCTPECLVSSSTIWDTLVYSRSSFYSKDMKAYIGYLKRQVAKYGIKSSRYGAAKEVYDLLNKTKVSVRLIDIIEDLPINEFCSIEEKNMTNREDVLFYNVCGSSHELTISIDELICRIGKFLDNYGVRVKLAERNEGIDWKAVSHALRAGFQLRDIFVDGDFSYPLKETEFILSVKNGELNFVDEVSPLLENLLSELEDLASKSYLPDKINTLLWDEYLLDVYDRYVLST